VKIGKKESLLEGPPPQLVDRMLRWWRFSKAAPFIERGVRVLDIGCSDGALFRYLGPRVMHGVGVDPALRRPVELATYRLIPGSFKDHVITNERFDVVTMLAVLEHLPGSDLRRLGDQCRRMLRPGGRVLVTVPSPRVDSILHTLQRLKLISGIGLHEHHGFEPSSVPKLFENHGFRLIVSQRFQLGLNHLFVFERSQEVPA
jgi:2-polyprenyl-3-methyl-5-hydroxy-6-metoxy-1,4-benzoquinol methylase